MDQSREERLREAIRLGREAECSRECLLRLLALRRSSLVHELEDGELTTDTTMTVVGGLKEIHFLERLIETVVYSGKLAEEELQNALDT